MYDHLGEAYFRINNYEKAKDAWEKSLKGEKNSAIEEKVKKANKLLRNKPRK